MTHAPTDAPRPSGRPDPRPSDQRAIAIDGPAASGKSSVGFRVAEALGVPFVSSGILYRAATRLCLDAGVDRGDPAAILERLARHEVELRLEPDGNRVVVDGRDRTDDLHTDAVDASVSTVASHPSVRAWIDARLRALPGSFVVEGRDMGTAVFPDAVAKIYLTASPEVRARRRLDEREAGFGELVRAIRDRDEADAKQLAPAADAHRIDTDDMTLDAVVAAVLDRVDPDDLRG